MAEVRSTAGGVSMRIATLVLEHRVSRPGLRAEHLARVLAKSVCVKYVQAVEI